MKWADKSNEQRADDLHMVKVFAYHCKRCNHVWLPKDYEFGKDKTLKLDWPKSCANCKSKQWREARVRNRIAPLKGLLMWAEELFKIGRQEGLDDKTIEQTMRVAAREKHASTKEINAVLYHIKSPSDTG